MYSTIEGKVVNTRELNDHIEHIRKELSAYAIRLDDDSKEYWSLLEAVKKLTDEIKLLRTQAETLKKNTGEEKTRMALSLKPQKVPYSCDCRYGTKCDHPKTITVEVQTLQKETYYSQIPDMDARQKASNQAELKEKELSEVRHRMQILIDTHCPESTMVLMDMQGNFLQIQKICKHMEDFYAYKNKNAGELILRNIAEIYRYLDYDAQLEILDLFDHMGFSATTIFDELSKKQENFQEIMNLPYQLHRIFIDQKLDQPRLYIKLQELTGIVDKIVDMMLNAQKTAHIQQNALQEIKLPLNNADLLLEEVKKCQKAIGRLDRSVKIFQMEQTKVTAPKDIPKYALRLLQKKGNDLQRKSEKLVKTGQTKVTVPQYVPQHVLRLLQTEGNDLQRKSERLVKEVSILQKEADQKEKVTIQVKMATIKTEIEQFQNLMQKAVSEQEEADFPLKSKSKIEPLTKKSFMSEEELISEQESITLQKKADMNYFSKRLATLKQEMKALQNEQKKLDTLQEQVKELQNPLNEVHCSLKRAQVELLYAPLIRHINILEYHLDQLKRIQIYTQNPGWQLLQDGPAGFKFIVPLERKNKVTSEYKDKARAELVKVSILSERKNANITDSYTLTKSHLEKTVEFLDSLVTCDLIVKYVFDFERKDMLEKDGLQKKAKELKLTPARELRFYGEAFRILDNLVSEKQLDRDVLVDISLNLQNRILELAQQEHTKEDNHQFRNEISRWGCLKHEAAERSIINWHQKPWDTTVSTFLTSNFTLFRDGVARANITTETHQALLKLFPVEMNICPADYHIAGPELVALSKW